MTIIKIVLIILFILLYAESERLSRTNTQADTCFYTKRTLIIDNKVWQCIDIETRTLYRERHCYTLGRTGINLTLSV